jgi:hypothetical protein
MREFERARCIAYEPWKWNVEYRLMLVDEVCSSPSTRLARAARELHQAFAFARAS